MKVTAIDEKGVKHSFNTEIVRLTDKDGSRYRLEQDIERGIEILGAGLSSKLIVEPMCVNQITVVNLEE